MSKNRDLAKFLKALGVAGQTISNIQAIKEAQKRQEVEDAITNLRKLKLQSEVDEIPEIQKARKSVDTLLNMASMQGPISVPFPGGGGGMEYQPAPEGLLSGANNVALEQAFQKAYGKSLPENLRVSDKPYPSASAMLKQRKAQGELGMMEKLPSQTSDATIAERTIRAYMRQADGKANAEDKLWIAKYPMPEPPENFQIDGVKFSIIRNIMNDTFPVEKDLMGTPTGRRVNLPEKEQEAFLQGNPIPMYKYIAEMWKKEQRLAEALGK